MISTIFFRWSFGEPMCQVITSSVVIIISSSIYHFVFINLDRLFAIRYSMTYKDRAARKKVKMGIALCWVLSFFPALPMWTHDSRTEINDGSGCKCSFPYKSVRLYYYLKGYNLYFCISLCTTLSEVVYIFYLA